jgi:alpha-beta hydrolase superfamily lysophospholipase
MSAKVRRSVVRVQAGGVSLVGTAHHVAGPDGVRGMRRVAFVLLNAGRAPRAGNSDLSSLLADHLAELDFPTFRIDLPGLGDSPGPAPEEDFFQRVLNGRNDAATDERVRSLCQTDDLDGVVLGGRCAGAGTSLPVASEGASGTLGVLLLEPNFRVTVQVDTTVAAEPQEERRRKRDEHSIGDALANRQLLQYLRGAGDVKGGSRPMQDQDRHYFMQQLDKVIVAVKKAGG